MSEYKLSTPIQAHGEEVSSITLRRPSVAECRAIRSLPYAIGKDEEVSLNLDAAAKYIAVCGAIPAPSVNQLDLADLNSLAWEVVGFFFPPASKAAKSGEVPS
ncbi:phage tail assembly protein [Pseudomonas sp. PS01297]|uniref:phage tail assembly protein n=1 Tax=Pseudomonas sp. PS01297 TaxID=2991433 RepID=UPI00249A48F3|nr:phage tail assembly protein [Pseudomonas sp. PS01297]